MVGYAIHQPSRLLGKQSRGRAGRVDSWSQLGFRLGDHLAGNTGQVIHPQPAISSTLNENDEWVVSSALNNTSWDMFASCLFVSHRLMSGHQAIASLSFEASTSSAGSRRGVAQDCFLDCRTCEKRRAVAAVIVAATLRVLTPAISVAGSGRPPSDLHNHHHRQMERDGAPSILAQPSPLMRMRRRPGELPGSHAGGGRPRRRAAGSRGEAAATERGSYFVERITMNAEPPWFCLVVV